MTDKRTPGEKVAAALAKLDPKDLSGPQHDAVKANTPASHPVHRTPRPAK